MIDDDELAELRDQVIALTHENVELRLVLGEAMSTVNRQKRAVASGTAALIRARAESRRQADMNIRIAAELERTELQRDQVAGLLCQATGQHLTFDEGGP